MSQWYTASCAIGTESWLVRAEWNTYGTQKQRVLRLVLINLIQIVPFVQCVQKALSYPIHFGVRIEQNRQAHAARANMGRVINSLSKDILSVNAQQNELLFWLRMPLSLSYNFVLNQDEDSMTPCCSSS